MLQVARQRADALAGRNLALLLGQLCLTGCLGASVLYSLLQDLCARCSPVSEAATRELHLSPRFECA